MFTTLFELKMSEQVLVFLVIYGLSHAMGAYVYNTEVVNPFNRHVNSRYLGGIHPYRRPTMKRSQRFPSGFDSWENSIQKLTNHMKTSMDDMFQNLDKTILQQHSDNALGNGAQISSSSSVVKIRLTCCKNGVCVTVHDPTSLNCNKILANKKQQKVDDNDPEKEQNLVDGQEKVTDTTTHWQEDSNQTPVDEQQQFDSVQTTEAVVNPTKKPTQTVKPVGGLSDAEVETFRKQLLDQTNVYRNQHGVNDLTIDEKINVYAQEWANHLAKSGKLLEHRTEKKYGENLFASSTKSNLGKEAADSWYNEIQEDGGYEFNAKESQIASRFSTFGHMTQLLWKNSKEMGVGVSKDSNGMYIVVANYNPPGNVMGQFKKNVFPKE